MKQFVRIEADRMQIHFMGFQLMVIQQWTDEAEQMFGWAADVVQVVFGTVLPDVGDQEFRVSHDGTYRCLDVVGHGQHQFLTRNQ